MEAVIEAWCVGCRRYVSPPPQGVGYGANRLGSPYVVYPCPRGHEVRWFIRVQTGRDLPPPSSAQEAEARAQCYAQGVREDLALTQRRLDRIAGVMEALGLLADFKLGLGVSGKTLKRMVDRDNARLEPGAGA